MSRPATTPMLLRVFPTDSLPLLPGALSLAILAVRRRAVFGTSLPPSGKLSQYRRNGGQVQPNDISQNQSIMNRFKILWMALLLFSASAIHAQTTTLLGIVADSLTREGEPYATIRVFKQSEQTKPVAMALTDAEGNMSIGVPNRGDFVVVISSVGKENISKPVTTRGESSLSLGTILMADSKQMLQEVEIVGRKPLVKMETDKMSYNVENDADAKSSTVLDMLRKVPMVTVDGQDNISVNGSSSFQVYVDGKPNMMISQNPSMAFKNMPASMVKNIEVITGPGARYDAEGATGILNIVTHRQQSGSQNMDGINGNIMLMGSNKMAGASASVSGQKGKLSFSANAVYNDKWSDGTLVSVDRQQFSPEGTSSVRYFQDGRYENPFAMASTALGYEIDSVSSVNASASFMQWKNINKGNPSTTIGNPDGSSYTYNNRMRQEATGTSWSAGLDYRRYFDAERSRSLTLAYYFSYNPQDEDNKTLFDELYHFPLDLRSRHSINRNIDTDHTFMADYTTPLGKGQKLDFGAKVIARRSKADATYYLDNGEGLALQPDLGLNYHFDNTIAAAYAEYGLTLPAWSMKTGLRYEHTWQKAEYKAGSGEDFKKNYGNLIPSATLTYNFAPTTNIGLNYNMRISRPAISFLNPYVDRSSPVRIAYGNTELEVEKTHNAGLVFNHYANRLMLNATLNFSTCNNGIENYNFYADGMLNNTYGNIVKRQTTSLNIFANWNITRSTRLMMNESLSYLHAESKALDMQNFGWNLSSMLSVQQQLPWNMSLSLMLINRTKNYSLQGWTSGFNMIHGSINKKLLGDKLNIGIMAISGLGHGGNFNFDTYSHGKDFTDLQNITVPVKFAMLTVSYSFGNTKVKQPQQTNKPDNDFKEKENQNIIPGIGMGQ